MRILGFQIHDNYSTITHLDVHFENGQHPYLLLYLIRAPTSYSYLEMVDNTHYSTFQSAYKVYVLLEDNKYWDFTLKKTACGSVYEVEYHIKYDNRLV